jgi:hypothetical protein
MNIPAMQEQLDEACSILTEMIDAFNTAISERIELNPNAYENLCIDQYIELFYKVKK